MIYSSACQTLTCIRITWGYSERRIMMPRVGGADGDWGGSRGHGVGDVCFCACVYIGEWISVRPEFLPIKLPGDANAAGSWTTLWTISAEAERDIETVRTRLDVSGWVREAKLSLRSLMMTPVPLLLEMPEHCPTSVMAPTDRSSSSGFSYSLLMLVCE